MTYFGPIMTLILTLSPVLIPLFITGAHALANGRRKSRVSAGAAA
jgi:hypothetical protein